MSRADVLAGDGPRGREVPVVTPEGVPIVFRLPPLGDRLFALLLDLAVLLAWLVLGGIVLGLLASGGLDASVVYAFASLLVFGLRFVGFTAAELRRGGATFGKRRLGLRVVDAAGGALSAEAVVVRNLLRELEFFLPLTALAVGTGPLAPLGAVWAFGFALFPCFHPRRQRVGDLFAGTLVVVVPRASLLADPGARAAAAAPGAAPSDGAEARADEAVPTFTDAMLDAYGEYELHVLEAVLRRGTAAGQRPEAFEEVARRIARKIAYPAPVDGAATLPFLRAYYAALRARLEHRRLLGRRKADKHDGRRPGGREGGR